MKVHLFIDRASYERGGMERSYASKAGLGNGTTEIDAKHHNIDAKLLIEEGVFGVHNSWVVMFGVDLQQAFNDSPQVW